MNRSLFTLAALVSTLSLAGFGCSNTGPDDEDIDAADAALDDCEDGSTDCKCADGSTDCQPCADGTKDCLPCTDPDDPNCDPAVPPCAPDDTNCNQDPAQSDCELVAKMLANLLDSVRSCSILSADDGCSIMVETTQGCPVPANASAPELGEYEELFEKYAESCPLPVPPCAVPAAMACVQAPDLDSTVGFCEAVPVTDPADADDAAN